MANDLSGQAGIVFYTDNDLDPKIALKVQRNLRAIADQRHMPIVCTSLKKMEFGDKNIRFPSKRKGVLTLFTQILAGLEHLRTDYVFFCEHDVLYHPSHFDFRPPLAEAYYYNRNVWHVWLSEGVATRTLNNYQTLGLCAERLLLLGHYQRRIAKMADNVKVLASRGIEAKNDGFSKHMGYEPGRHMKPRGVDEYPALTWDSDFPILDLRHDRNFTKGKRSPRDFKNPDGAVGWLETRKIPGWGEVDGLL